MVRSGQRVQIYDGVVSSPGVHSSRWAACGVVHGGCSDVRGYSTRVAAGDLGQRSEPVSIDKALSNHATQRTPCARRLKKGKNTVGGAHGAADGGVGQTENRQRIGYERQTLPVRTLVATVCEAAPRWRVQIMLGAVMIAERSSEGW